MENFINIFLLEKKRTIENENKTSDNKAYHIRREKIELVNSLITVSRIPEKEKAEAVAEAKEEKTA